MGHPASVVKTRHSSRNFPGQTVVQQVRTNQEPQVNSPALLSQRCSSQPSPYLPASTHRPFSSAQPKPVIRTYKTSAPPRSRRISSNLTEPQQGSCARRSSSFTAAAGTPAVRSGLTTIRSALRIGHGCHRRRVSSSNQKDITPLEAMADTRDLIRWVREHAAELAIDPHRVAVYGHPLADIWLFRQRSFLTTRKARQAPYPTRSSCSRPLPPLPAINGRKGC